MRFPEFTGEWEKHKVSDLLDTYSTNSLSWEQLNYKDEGLYNLHYGLVHVGLPTMIDMSKDNIPTIKADSVPKNYELCQEGDVAFADASEDTNEVAKVVEFFSLADKRVICGLHTIHGRDNKDKTVVGFKGYAFSSPAFHNQIRRIAQGTKIYSISSKNFTECTIGIPSKEEQKKIATLFRLLDERISTQIRVIEKLESLMGGINDRLHEEVSGMPTSFEELGEAYSGLSGKSAEDFGCGFPFITYMNVYANQRIDTSHHELVRITEDERQNKVQYGDILFTLSSETPEEVGIGAVYLGHDENLYLNSFCFGIHITAREKVYYPYFAYFVSNNTFRHFVFPLAQGSTRYNLQKGDFMKKKFQLPPKNMQIKIANALDTLSTKLSTERELLKSYETQKEYLLRQMFI